MDLVGGEGEVDERRSGRSRPAARSRARRIAGTPADRPRRGAASRAGAARGPRGTARADRPPTSRRRPAGPAPACRSVRPPCTPPPASAVVWSGWSGESGAGCGGSTSSAGSRPSERSPSSMPRATANGVQPDGGRLTSTLVACSPSRRSSVDFPHPGAATTKVSRWLMARSASAADRARRSSDMVGRSYVPRQILTTVGCAQRNQLSLRMSISDGDGQGGGVAGGDVAGHRGHLVGGAVLAEHLVDLQRELRQVAARSARSPSWRTRRRTRPGAAPAATSRSARRRRWRRRPTA